MHRTGHYGAGLLVYAPLGGIAVLAGAVEVAIAGGAVTLALAMLPDWDQRVPGLRHRGPTHTVWFVLAVSAVTGLAGGVIGATTGLLAAVGLGVFGALVGAGAIGSHLAADALTPMGIRPLAPVRDDEYSLDIARAANPLANYALLALGVTAAAAALWLASALRAAV